MSFWHLPARMRGQAEVSHIVSTRLHGHWLVIARVVWMALVIFTVSSFALSLPAYFAQLQTICTGSLCTYSYGQLTPGSAQALQHLGLSIGSYAASTFAFFIASALVSFGVAGALFWRRSDDWMALLVSLFLVTFGVNFSAQGLVVANQQTAWNVPLTIVTLLGWTLFNLLFYLFPDGQFVPRWTRALAVFGVVINLFLNTDPEAFFRLPSWLAGAFFSVIGVSGVVAQIYRYLRVSGPVQRQQTKWVIFGLAATAIVVLGKFVLPLIFPSLSTTSSLYFLLLTYVYSVGVMLIPLTLGFAVLRYRLWDIDRIINKALVYGLLTGILAAIYVGLILGLQALFGGLFHQTSAIALVVSTLAIAALFRPLRQRIQAIIDRRFYRKKYDAAQTLAAFNAVLRTEVDLTTLSEHLLTVVQETMQPASVSLWLRPPEQRGKFPVSEDGGTR